MTERSGIPALTPAWGNRERDRRSEGIEQTHAGIALAAETQSS